MEKPDLLCIGEKKKQKNIRFFKILNQSDISNSLYINEVSHLQFRNPVCFSQLLFPVTRRSMKEHVYESLSIPLFSTYLIRYKLLGLQTNSLLLHLKAALLDFTCW